MEEEMTAVWFEKIVKDCTWLSPHPDPADSVLDLVVEDAVPKGFNYSGRLLRLKASIGHKSGKTNQASVVLKSMPLNKDQSTFITEHKLFLTETLVYDKILSKMETLLTESKVYGELDWPKHYTVSKETLLLLQDLKELDYSTVQQRQATYNEGVLVVRAIGRLHAMSLILTSEGTLDMSDYQVNNMSDNHTIVQFVYISTLRAIIDAIRTTKQEKWYSHAEMVESCLDKIGPALKEVAKSSKGSNDVLNHGDCWLNNVMFKYSHDTKEPKSIKLIDFQLCYYNSFAWDLVHFTYCSYLTDTREKLKPRLVSEYRASLLETLQQLNGGNEILHKVQTEEEILHCMDKLSLFGYLVGMATVPRMLPDIKSSLDLDITLPDHAYKLRAAVYSLPEVFPHVTKDLTQLCNILKSL